MAVSRDQKQALTLLLQQENRPNAAALRLRARGLNAGGTYLLNVRPVKVALRDFGGLVNMISPVHIKQDSILQCIAEKVIAPKSEREDIKVCKINVDEEPELAIKYGIATIPTLLVFENGKTVNKYLGVQPKFHILDML